MSTTFFKKSCFILIYQKQLNHNINYQIRCQQVLKSFYRNLNHVRLPYLRQDLIYHDKFVYAIPFFIFYATILLIFVLRGTEIGKDQRLP